ncbi:metallophosphoesterase [Paucibacter sp. APW11]|uniref:Metallophosphoesterase n=1 Tax=Roseateles aquae TaxID=3077235 RepID=A0ABU3PH86_9BURK|nr:metallophosphoesterase [Paucibacter sp. APW11]MDT9001937.1 metallophosphoesterase [Paucibacter sp. APW11]
MKIQLLSDLHLETETFVPEVAADAELLVLAGDVDSSWRGLELFRNWPVPVVFVPGNHEYDRREITTARAELQQLSDSLGFIMLDDAELLLSDRQGRQIRLLGSTRWSDFDLFGERERERAMRAAGYFQRVMGSSWQGQPFDAAAVRELSLVSRDWLAQALSQKPASVDATVVITHFAPSIRSADPRYGRQPGTASFCNNDEALLPLTDVWIHGHLHCRHDYAFTHPGGSTRVICNARGHGRKGEADGYRPQFCLDI